MRQLVAVVGPSGAGKDLLMRLACEEDTTMRSLRRMITRPTEAGGEDFEGVTPESFAQRLAEGAFLLHWQAHGLQYGLPKAALPADGTVLMNCSRKILPAAQALWPNLITLYVTAPPDVLAARLAARGRETALDQAARLGRAAPDLPQGLDLRVIVNDQTPQIGLARLRAALQPVRA